MINRQTCAILPYLRKLIGEGVAQGATDAALLRRFTADQDQTAFTALVERHGTLVLSVCRRVLGNDQDAEDSFQATFLLLARKAGSIRKGQSLASWLYGVAYRIALKARTCAARRRARERRAAGLLHQPSSCELALRELQIVLDEELNRLPEKYRAPFVLCCLEGKSKREAAQELGWKEGTVSTRIGEARTRLQCRLARRGVTLSAVLCGLAVSQGPASAAPFAGLLERTAEAAAPCAATAPAGAASAHAVALARGVLRGLWLAKLKNAALVALALGALAVGAGMVAHPPAPPKQTDGKEEAKPGPAELIANRSKTDASSKVREDWYGDPLPPGALVRMGSVQLRQQYAHVAFSADGKTLISASRLVRSWDLQTGKEVRCTPIRLAKCPESQPGPTSEGLSPDGKILVAMGAESVYLYDTRTGQELQRFSIGPFGHHKVAFSADGKTLATMVGLGGRFVIRLWEVSTGKERLALKETSFISSLAFSPDGKILASVAGAAGKQTLILRDTITGRELGSVRTDGENVAFSPDGKTVATGNRYGTVMLWEAATLKEQSTLYPAAASWTSSCLTYSPDGRFLAVARDKDVVLWDVVGRKEQRRIAERHARQLLFAPDGKTLASAGELELHLWDVTTGARLHGRPGHDSHVWSVAFSPDGKVAASSACNDPNIRLWDAATGKPLVVSLRHDDSVRSCDFSSNGMLVASSGSTLRFWQTATGKELRRFVIEDLNDVLARHEVLVCHLSPDGRRLAAVSCALDRARNRERSQMSVWDAETGKLLARRPFAGGLTSRFTPDGAGVTIDSSRALIVEETATGRIRLSIPGDLGHPVAFRPDGMLLAVGIHETSVEAVDGLGGGWKTKGVRVAELATGQEIFHVEGSIDFVAFSPDGRVLATADPQGLRLWDALTGDHLFQRAWPENLAHGPLLTPIASLVFLPGGRAVATGMADGTILVWDLVPATRRASQIASNLGRKELEVLWSDLAADAPKAYRALRMLAAAPVQAVPFLNDHLQPVAAADPQRVRQLIADLDNEKFTVRDLSARELAKLGEKIEPALSQALERHPSAEVRRRVQALLAGTGTPPSAAVLRTLRAIQALERIGTPQAQNVLRKLSTGAPPARETRTANQAFERLGRQFRSSAGG